MLCAMLESRRLLVLLLLPLPLACSREEAAVTTPTGVDAAAAEEAPEDERTKLLRVMSAPELDALEGDRGVRVNEPGAFPGYTLIAPVNSTQVHLVALDGTVAHTWETGLAPGAWSYLLDDGTLLRCARNDDAPKFKGGGIGGILQRLAPDGTVLWRHRIADDEQNQHHDLEPLPNGNFLLIAWERKSAEEAIALGRHPQGVGEPGLWPDAVLELEPTPPEGARVVWKWHAWDHLVQDVDPAKPNYGELAAHPGRIDINADFEPEESEEERREREEMERQMAAIGYAGGEEPEEDAPRDGPAPDRFEKTGDWLHCNAVAYHAELDLIVLSSPRLSEIFVIDHSTTIEEAASSSGGRHGRGGELLWRWGNPVMHGAGGASDQRLFAQHDPTWVGGADAPRVLVFDNGSGRPGDVGYSRVLELALPFSPATGFDVPERGKHGPAAPAWSYEDRGNFYSAFISGAQRLPNGNTLVCSGASGRVFEVTASGELVWEYLNPHGGDVKPPEHAGNAPPLALFRATRLAPDHPGVRALLQ